MKTEWMADAACAGVDQTLFFPQRGESPGPAKAYCARCPVTDECLAYALVWRIKQGVWGNTSAVQRTKIKKPPMPEGFGGPRHLALAIEPALHGTKRRYDLDCRCTECRWANRTRGDRVSGRTV